MRMRGMREGIFLAAVLVIGCGDDGANGDGSGTDGDSATSTSGGSSTDPSSTGGTSSDSAGSTSTGADETTSSTTDPGTTGETTSGSDSSDGSGDSSGSSEGTSGESSSSGGPMVIDDPFDPASCGGTALTQADLTAALGGPGGMDRQVLATATIQVRERTCPGGMCGDWGEGFDWVIHYLTWSGGVVTAYKDFQADMQLVVFDDQGTPRLSLQHVTFDVPSSTYDDTDGMVYDVPPSPIGYPHVRAYDDDPDSEYYYQELDWLVRDGVLTVGEDCVRWVADPYIQQPPFTEQYAVVFHW